MDRTTGRTTPARSTTQSPQLQQLPQVQQQQHHRQPNSAPQLIQDLLTHDPVPAECRDRQTQQSEPPSALPTQSNAQRHACEPCRIAKAKCEFSSGPGDSNGTPSASGPCKRCARTDRECVFAERTKTRRRKRRESSSGLGGTDQRVEELERRIENLVAIGINNGISGFEGIAGNKSNGISTGPKDGDKGRVLEQRSRIEDVLNSPLERNDGREAYPGPPAHKRTRFGSMPDEVGNANGQQHPQSIEGLGQHMFGQPSTSARTAYTPISPTTSYQSRQQPSPTQPPYDPTRPPQEPPARPRMSQGPYKDVIDQGYISLSLATLLYNHFTVELLPHTPFIVLPPFFTTAACRETRPTLFLAIIVGTLQRPPAALSDSVSEANANALIDELHWVLADKIMYRGEKSLEIVQALLVAVSWYTVPAEQHTMNAMERHKGFMWITQAISMALELGLARRGTGMRSPPLGSQCSKQSSRQPQGDEIEGRRAALGCYWMSVNVCMIVKRPHLMKWSGPLENSLEVLQRGSENDIKGIAPTDKILVEMVKAARIVEESGFTGCSDNFHELMGSGFLKIGRVKFIITALEKQVEDWWNNVPENVKYHNSISLTYHALQIYIHEICLHSEYPAKFDSHGPDGGFKASVFNDNLLQKKFGKFFGWNSIPTLPPALTSSYLPIIIKSSHGLLDTFLSLGKGTIEFLPHVAFGRVCYAVLVLVKIERVFNASNGVDKPPVENLAEELKLGYYLERVLVAFGKDYPKVNNKCSYPGPKSCLGRLFQNMKNWWDRQVKMGDCGGSGEVECRGMRGLFSGHCGSSSAPAAAADSGLGGNYMTPSSSAETPGPSGTLPSFTPVNASTNGNGYSNPGEHIATPESIFGATMTGAGDMATQEELTLGGWNLTDEDWIALMNAGGSGLQLFDY